MPLNYPPIDELLKKTENCYTLVVESSKRARDLVAGAQPMVETDSQKPVSIAVDEIYNGYLRYDRISEEETER